MEKTKLFYDKAAEYYDTVMGITNRNIVEVTALLEGERIKHILKYFNFQNEKYFLDLGCGTGNLCSYLGFLRYKVIGVDISNGMLEAALIKKDIYALDTVRFICKDIAFLGRDDITEDIGFIYSKELCNNILDRKKLRNALKAVGNLAAPSTVIIIEAFTELGLSYLIQRCQRRYNQFTYLQQGTYDSVNKSGHIDYSFNPGDANFKGLDAVMPIKYWGESDFKEILADSGFYKIDFFDSQLTVFNGADESNISFNPVSDLSGMFLIKAVKI